MGDLGDVADVRLEAIPTLIKHEDISAYIDVLADVNGRSVASVQNEISTELSQLNFPLEYHPELRRDITGRAGEQSRLLEFAAAATVGIFLVLQLALGSWRLAGMAFLSLSAALVGGVVVAVALDDVTSVGSLAGLVAVLAIAGRSTILLISHCQHLEHDEGEPLSAELVLRAARERVVPNITATVTAGLAFLPLVVLGSTTGLEILQPMAAVFLGGLVTSTLLNLFLVPAMYLLLSSTREINRSGAILGID